MLRTVTLPSPKGERSGEGVEALQGENRSGMRRLPKVRLDLTSETRGEVVEFLEKAEQSGKWPQKACTTMFFLIPKNVSSEKPIALMPTMIRWWEALRAQEVAKWRQEYRIHWDATDSLGKI